MAVTKFRRLKDVRIMLITHFGITAARAHVCTIKRRSQKDLCRLNGPMEFMNKNARAKEKKDGAN